jgi:ABC-2 type transport system ATP-binding protein
VIEVRNLTKDYGTVVAVRDLSFAVEKGEIVGFLGPNGAGKSTTLRVLSGFLGATSGRVRIAGHDIGEAPRAARRSLGYMPESAPLYPELRVGEYLQFRARLKEVPRDKQRAAIASAMERAGVAHMAGTVIGHLSKGYRQRVALADALVADPPLLILDEPTAGLDPNQIREVRSLIKGLAGERTILLSTHILSEVEATCERAIVIDRGQLVAEGRIEELRARQKGSLHSVRVRDPQARAEAAISGISGLELRSVDESSRTSERRTLHVALSDGLDAEAAIEDLVRALTAAGIGIHALIPEQASLEQVFSALTAHEHDAGGEGKPRSAP